MPISTSLKAHAGMLMNSLRGGNLDAGEAAEKLAEILVSAIDNLGKVEYDVRQLQAKVRALQSQRR